ncbi:MAG TPA: type 1 glutamine amidotransferase domain-containing protein [Bacteroidales bacterium]|nr:type 1 glutamine amidotransferase domain-containing protein [Bacteroidales bacterium]
MKKILIVVTSNNVKGATGQPTGYYLSEVSHAWDVFVKNGYEVDFVSPKGGEAPGEGLDFSDPVNKAFWDNETYHNKIQHTLKPSEVKPEDYAAIYYAGGHGTMWDLADNKELQEICRRIYENNGVVSAVCHGPVGLLNVKLSDGKYLVEGKKVNTFTDAEEKAVKLDNVVPYLLESEMKKRGVVYESSDLWQAHVAVDDRLVTGQNPASAKGVGEAVVKLLK